jgi:thiamine-phosphate pyrophosphorylase
VIADPPLLLVTDRRQAARPLDEILDAAFTAGCRWASLREKDLPPAAQVALAQGPRAVADRHGARLTLHGEAATAAAAGLSGVHLSAGSDAGAARALLGRRALIGISIHSVAEARALDPDVVDYAVAGPAFPTASKPGYGPELGPAGIRAMVETSRVPILAIGGIAAARVGETMRAGAAGIAVMGSVMRAGDPAGEVRALLAALDAHLAR